MKPIITGPSGFNLYDKPAGAKNPNHHIGEEMDAKAEDEELALLFRKDEENAYREFAGSITDKNAENLIKRLDAIIDMSENSDLQKGRALYLKGVALFKIKKNASARECMDNAVGFNNPSAMLFLAITPDLQFNPQLVKPLYMRAKQLDLSIAKLLIDISEFEDEQMNNYRITTNKIKLGLYFFKTKYMGQEKIEAFWEKAIRICETSYKK